MRKTYILDTNVLLHDPESLFSFEDNAIVLPLSVIEELDRIKRRSDEVGRNAREVSRRLDELRMKRAVVRRSGTCQWRVGSH